MIPSSPVVKRLAISYIAIFRHLNEGLDQLLTDHLFNFNLRILKSAGYFLETAGVDFGLKEIHHNTHSDRLAATVLYLYCSNQINGEKKYDTYDQFTSDQRKIIGDWLNIIEVLPTIVTIPEAEKNNYCSLSSFSQALSTFGERINYCNYICNEELDDE